MDNAGISHVGEEWFDPAAPSHFMERIPEFLHGEIRSMAENGMSTRSIARALGYHRNQVRRVLRKYPSSDASLCPCGEIRKHQGWCYYRYLKSDLRQDTLKVMHVKRRAVKLLEEGTPEGQVRIFISEQLSKLPNVNFPAHGRPSAIHVREDAGSPRIWVHAIEDPELIQARQARQCSGKIEYTNEIDVAAAALRMSEGRTWPLRHYKCGFCGGWHYGHMLVKPT